MILPINPSLIRAKINGNTEERIISALCPYCGETLSGRATNKDHVVSRRGMRNSNAFNVRLIVHEECNTMKSNFDQILNPFCIMDLPWVSGSGNAALVTSMITGSHLPRKPLGIPSQITTRLIDHLHINDWSPEIKWSETLHRAFTIIYKAHIQALYSTQTGDYIPTSQIHIREVSNYLKDETCLMRFFYKFGDASVKYNIGEGSLVTYWWWDANKTSFACILIYGIQQVVTVFGSTNTDVIPVILKENEKYEDKSPLTILDTLFVKRLRR